MKIDNFHIGYPCVNLSLNISSFSIQKNTFNKGKLQLVSEVSIRNLENLLRILEWNRENEIDFYRMSSGIFPWWSEYILEDLPDFEKISSLLSYAGNIVKESNQRVTFHPGPFTVLASPHEYVRKKAIYELEQHSKMLDLMGFEPSFWNKINIHIGGAYGNKESAIDQWIRSWEKLSDNAKKRVVVENDDKSSMYSVKDLYDSIYKKIKIPVTFDSFHHGFCDGGLSVEEASHLAASTWKDVPPCFHFSSSMKLNESSSAKSTAHADWIYEDLQDWGTGAYIMVESKAKDLAILAYREVGKGNPALKNILNESLKEKINLYYASHI